MPWGTVSTLTLPADNGTWGLGFITSAKDAALRGLKDTDTWMRAWRSFPLVAHWADGEPIDDDVAIMTKIEDRHRSFVVDGTPVATGVLAVADSWACTNPSLGRGASIGLMHAVALRDLLRVASFDFPMELAQRWHEVTESTVEPYYRATLDFDRHRLAEIDAGIEGKAYDPGDPAVRDGPARWLRRRGRTPSCSARCCSIAAVLASPEEVFATPGVAEKVIELGANWRDDPVLAPTARRIARHRGRLTNGDDMRIDSSGVTLDVQVEGEGPPGRVVARLPRHEAVVVEADSGVGRRGLPGDRARPARLRRERQADRARGVLDPVPRDRRDRDPRSPRARAGARRRARLGLGHRVGDRGVRARTRRPSRHDVGRASRRRSRTWACCSTRSRGTCCCSSSATSPSSGSR